MIYLDNAATTQVHPDVFEAMQPYLSLQYGNPSSIHAFGRAAKAALDRARAQLASFVGAQPQELTFTSGGTEAIHTALFGAFLASGSRKHLVTTAVEHHAVLHTCDFLRTLGCEVTIVKPTADGQVRVEDVVEQVRPDTFLVSVMAVNNETGAVLPVDDIARAVKDKVPTLQVHSDMVQALGTLRLDLNQSAVDFASFSGHKVYGPKGIGALYIRKGSNWKAVLHGGAQERERRAGTENVAGIVGFGAAVQRLHEHWDAHITHLTRVRDAFWNELEALPGIIRNSPRDAVPSILNVWFEGVRNDTLLMRLDMAGVAASAGSACTAGSLEPSHVLQACGYPDERVRQSIRFSFSAFNSEAEMARAAELTRDIVRELRR